MESTGNKDCSKTFYLFLSGMEKSTHKFWKRSLKTVWINNSQRKKIKTNQKTKESRWHSVKAPILLSPKSKDGHSAFSAVQVILPEDFKGLHTSSLQKKKGKQIRTCFFLSDCGSIITFIRDGVCLSAMLAFRAFCNSSGVLTKYPLPPKADIISS